MKVFKNVALVGLCLFALSFTALRAQTVIDLKRGGVVRAKTIDDYREEAKVKERLAADSLAYVDHLTRALNALGRDSLAQAEQLFKEALRVRPEAPSNYIVRHNLGEIYLAQGRYREAITRFSEVLKEHPEVGEARYERAVSYYEMGNQQAALEDCSVLLNGNPATHLRVKALFLQAGIHMKSRQPHLAKTDVEEIIRLDPDNQNAHLLEAGALEALGQSQNALHKLDAFVEAHPENVEGRLARAELEMRLTVPDLAVKDYDAAILLAPENPEFFIGRAKANLQLKRFVAARKDLDAAVALGIPRGMLNAYYQQLKK